MTRLFLSPPHLDGQERQLLLDAFDSNWITTLGPHVEAFEREMCACIDVAGSVALSSGTAGLHLALVLLGIQPEDEVLCSDLTFAATCNVVEYCKARPVLIDSNAETWNMDPALLGEELASCKKKGRMPRAAIVVDLYGQTADYDPILQLCSDYGVPVIEDAAESLGATYKGRPAGTFGEMGIFSFNGNKIITTSGGGMLVSNNINYVIIARHLANQARDPLPYYHHTSIGFNYRLSNLLAAVGRAQLQGLGRKVERRREINVAYRKMLAGVSGLAFMPEAPYGTSNHWLTCVTVNPEEVGKTTEDIRLYLETRNIESRPVWKPMHLQPVFKDCRIAGGSVSENIFRHGLCLPSGSAMSDDDIHRVVESILDCIENRNR